MIDIYDINTPKKLNSFELMKDIHISLKDLRLFATTTLMQKNLARDKYKKEILKILKGDNKYE